MSDMRNMETKMDLEGAVRGEKEREKVEGRLEVLPCSFRFKSFV